MLSACTSGNAEKPKALTRSQAWTAASSVTNPVLGAPKIRLARFEAKGELVLVVVPLFVFVFLIVRLECMCVLSVLSPFASLHLLFI